MTKLCCFNQDNSHFSAFEHHTTNELSRLHSSVSQTLIVWICWTVTSGSPCSNSTMNSSWIVRRLMSYKSPCRSSATRTRHQGSGELHRVLESLLGCVCHWWSFRAPAAALCIFKSASSSHHQQTDCCWWQRSKRWEMAGRLSWKLKQHIFVIFEIYIST